LSGPEITPVRGRLEAKVAVVTGAARGIGKAIASRFAEEGASVVLADIDGDAAEHTSAKLREGGKRILAVQADVSSRESVDAMIDASVREFGAIDILVNNAGIIVFGSLMDCRPGDWDRMMAVDLSGAFHCTQAAGRQMVRQGRGGRLIHIGSAASLLPAPAQAAYAVAKAGLVMLSRTAALELAPHGITSNLLCPLGAVTDINRDLLSDPEVMARLESSIPAGRLATVEEIAAAVAFLACDEAAYITGTELVHDGGISISGLWWRGGSGQ
jgi:NAD(P)-dependent dehydrogenase (short-subunit alcohol dehydrogenase family)